MTLPVARDLQREGIRVNAILPGVVVTEGTTALGHGFERFAERVPVKRVGRPDEIGAVAQIGRAHV